MIIRKLISFYRNSCQHFWIKDKYLHEHDEVYPIITHSVSRIGMTITNTQFNGFITNVKDYTSKHQSFSETVAHPLVAAFSMYILLSAVLISALEQGPFTMSFNSKPISAIVLLSKLRDIQVLDTLMGNKLSEYVCLLFLNTNPGFFIVPFCILNQPWNHYNGSLLGFLSCVTRSIIIFLV